MSRAVRDCLPTKERLISRRVTVDGKCPTCNLSTETVYHILVTCHFISFIPEPLSVSQTWQGNMGMGEWLVAVM